MNDPGAIWSNDQGPEHYNGQCYEHMSDMLCRFSNARIIHNSQARTLVHWRNSNHYPVQLIPSDGTRIHAYDRPASTCPATFFELQHKDGNNIEAMVMYGLTDKKVEELTSLNRSWNFAPDVIDTKGCQYKGYEKRERAFMFSFRNNAVEFTIKATKEQPLENPAFVIANWPADYAGISLKMNGRKKTRGGDYKAGIEMGTDGSYALVIWMEYSSTRTVAFEIVKD
jgi:hypothetical protein